MAGAKNSRNGNGERAKSPIFVLENEGQRSVQVLIASEGAYRLLPGETVEVEMVPGNGPFRFCLYEGGVQLGEPMQSTPGIGTSEPH